MPARPASPVSLPGLRYSLTPILVCLVVCPVFAQRDLTDIPEPDPVAERQSMNVDAQAAVNLFAADPDISKPIQINFDPQGGLWVASSEVYPQIKPGQIANDKIVVLRDTDGDGISDRRVVFADGLLIPTGVIPDGPDAAYVAESTRLLYLQDTDGDGKADQRRVVLSGFGTEDTHHLVHTLRFGPDGCLYFNQSIYIHSHIETPFGTRHLDGGGIWRYQPATGRLEIFCKGFINPWGHTFDPVGESFVTDGAFFEGINYAFPDAVFVTSPGATRWLKGLNPGSPKHCGLEILSGTHIPPEWSGDLVTNDFRSHRVCRFTIKPNGSGYISRQQPEIVTTGHVAFRPIDARMGPDGALYIADWYNPIIQHGEVDFRDDRRDLEHGRIWRVSFPERDLDHWPRFDELPPVELLALLEDPSLAARQFARQELWRRAETDPHEIADRIGEWASEKPASRLLEKSWLAEAVGSELNPDSIAAMEQVEAEAKRTYLRSLWRRRGTATDPTKSTLKTSVLDWLMHEDARVRLEAVVAAGQMEGELGLQAVQAILDATRRDVDANLEFAIWQSLRSLDRRHDSGTILAELSWQGRHAELAYAVDAIATIEAAEVAVSILEADQADRQAVDELVSAIAVAGDAEQLGRVVRALLKADPNNLSAQRFKPFLDRTLRDRTIPAGIGKVLASSASDESLTADPARTRALARMAGVWKIGELEETLIDKLEGATGRLKERIIEALGALDSPASHDALKRLASDKNPITRVAATAAIASRRPIEAIPLALPLLQDDRTGDAGENIVVGLLSRKIVPDRLAKALSAMELPTDRARSLLRRVQSAGGHAGLEQAIRASGKLENASWQLTAELQKEILAAVESEGSAQRGEDVYRRQQLQCIKCHAIGTAGGLVGPNLISIGGSSQPDYILESLLDPSAKLKEGYTTLSVLTDEAEVINGIVIGRDTESVRLRLADGKEVQISTDSIEQEKPGKSLMPEGLLDSLTQAELVDLTKFLTVLGKEPEMTVSTKPLVRTFESLVYTDQANRRLNRTSADTAASGDPAMQWRAETATVDGTIPLSELDQFRPHRQTAPTSFIRFDILMPSDGTASIRFPTEAIEAWVDTKPTPTWDLQSLELAAGTHTIVLAIDRNARSEPFAIELAGDAVESGPTTRQ